MIEVSLCDFDRGILIKSNFYEDDIAVVDIKNARILRTSQSPGISIESELAVKIHLKKQEKLKLDSEIEELEKRFGVEIENYYSKKYDEMKGE